MFRRSGWLYVCAGLFVAACSDDEEGEAQARADAGRDAAADVRTVAQCFADIGGAVGPDYDQFDPTVGSHCLGTNHQDIENVERVVFLGDSVTRGTPPTPQVDFYRTRLSAALRERFGEIDVSDCSRFGARNDDFLQGDAAQIPMCFPEGGDSRRTLVVFTMGGNDISSWAGGDLSAEAATVEADAAAELLDAALGWLKDPERFPAGSFVVFANPYEFTDGTGDLQSCALAATGFGGVTDWKKGADAVVHFQERYMQLAVQHDADLIFLLEHFCGHGFHNEDPESQCYRGPGTPRWFDLTCIHPTPEGHAEIADMFLAVVDE